MFVGYGDSLRAIVGAVSTGNQAWRRYRALWESTIYD